MIKNYLKIAWRNILRNKVFSFVNIAGLAIGLSCFTLIALYVDELSYDRYNKKADRFYRVDSEIRFGGTDQQLAVASDPMGATLKRDYPQVGIVFHSPSTREVVDTFLTRGIFENAELITLAAFLTLPLLMSTTNNWSLSKPRSFVTSHRK